MVRRKGAHAGSRVQEGACDAACWCSLKKFKDSVAVLGAQGPGSIYITRIERVYRVGFMTHTVP